METHFADVRPSKMQEPERDLSVTKILSVDNIGFADSSRFGVKTANVATLRTLGFPDGTVPKGFGVPFHFYDAFMKHNGFYDKVEAMLKDLEFLNDQDTKAAELKKFRAEIKNGEMPAWMMDALSELHSAFPEGTSLRCRSSTNNEDLPGFSGAGLYDSYTHHPSEGHLSKSIKQVFASLWNTGHLRHGTSTALTILLLAMGVLVHPNLEMNRRTVSLSAMMSSIKRQGITTSIFKLVRDLVTNPEEQSIPEEILLDWWDSNNYRVVTTSNRDNGWRPDPDRCLFA